MNIKNIHFGSFIVFILNIVDSTLCNKCNEDGLEKPLIYKLVKTNAYSLKPALSRKEVSNVQKCKEFAAENKALAFNFGQHYSQNDASDNISDPFNMNCIILLCPEINNFTALVNVTGFSYYSAYYKNTWLENETLSCVPSIGLFMISNNQLNYTDAHNSCLKMNGSLAHIASEKRTESLAALIGNYSAFVGLSGDKNEKIWKNECGDPLYCFDYRAWSKGEPSSSYGCVELIHYNSRSIPVWKITSCKRKLRYLCEISPSYYRSRNNITVPNCI